MDTNIDSPYRLGVKCASARSFGYGSIDSQKSRAEKAELFKQLDITPSALDIMTGAEKPIDQAASQQ